MDTFIRSATEFGVDDFTLAKLQVLQIQHRNFLFAFTTVSAYL